MGILFGIIVNFLQLPIYIRYFVELAILLLLTALFWPLIRYILVIVLKVAGILSEKIFGSIRYLVCILAVNSKKVHMWDEKIGIVGRAVKNSFVKAGHISEYKAKEVFMKKIGIIIIVIIYFAAIFPELGLRNIMDDYYFERLCAVNKVFAGMEGFLAKTAGDYPPLFIKMEKAEESSEEVMAVSEEVKPDPDPVYLMLNEETYYANVRETADANGNKCVIVSKEDKILYQNEYKYDGERYWLKVKVESQDNQEGWMSANILDRGIVDLLNLGK